MEMIQIAALAMVACVIILLLKQYKPEYAAVAGIAAGLFIFVLILEKLIWGIGAIQDLISQAGMHSGYMTILLKVLGISLLTQFAANTCKDAGQSALASQVELAGKILILVLALPLFEAVTQLVSAIIKQ